MLVSILITTFNRFKITSQYLPSILSRIGNVEHEILIWDNCSNDGTTDWLLEQQKIYPAMRPIYCHDSNFGMQAFNVLADEAKGKYLLKVDDDLTVPSNFVPRLINAFEEVNDSRLAYLGWDMAWGPKSFALRSNIDVYKLWGKVIHLSDKSSVYISYEPSKWMINGVCRICLKEVFLKLGGHPHDIVYGVDYHVSKQAHAQGYWVGFYSPSDLVIHHGEDTPKYRQFKDEQLRKAKAPRHV